MMHAVISYGMSGAVSLMILRLRELQGVSEVNSSVALADESRPSSAQSRHRNKHVIRIDSIPLGEVVLCKVLRESHIRGISLVLRFCGLTLSLCVSPSVCHRGCCAFCRNGMCRDSRDVVRTTLCLLVAYYNLPRGKWSTLIKYMLRWRKRAVRWQHWTARATLSMKLNEVP